MIKDNYENGGAEAIKGFNYQKANLILLAINNFHKDNFRIYIESDDDIVAEDTDYRALIQVKKQKHTFKTITTKPKNNTEDKELKESILEKNLRSGLSDDTYKLIVQEFGSTDSKKLVKKKPGTICTEMYALNADAKKNIIALLPNDIAKRINKFFIIIPPISTNLIEAEKYLIGSLGDNDISVDNKRGRNIIAELSLTIDQKAEEILSEGVNKEIKSITAEYLKQLFITCKSLDGFDNILDSLNYNHAANLKIKKERLKIELNKSSLKEEMKEFLRAHFQTPMYLFETNTDVINRLIKNFEAKEPDLFILISVGVESLSELGDDF
ncbi:DUF4297 domain-containing protein [Alkalihalobacillus sp. FSL W8-0930]